MKNKIDLTRLINSKKNRTEILTDGGQMDGNRYTPGTRYTGFVSVNYSAVYRQEIMPETVMLNGVEYQTSGGAANRDITGKDDYKEIFDETEFTSVVKFPVDISLNYKGGDKASYYLLELPNGEIEVFAYETQYIKPLNGLKRFCVGNPYSKGLRRLYALDENNAILGIVTPFPIKPDSPLQSFVVETVKGWHSRGDEALVGFKENLCIATERSKQHYETLNKQRIAADEQAWAQRKAEQEAQEAARVDELIKSLSVSGTEISGKDLIAAARKLEFYLHPRTIGSISERVKSVTVQGSGVSFVYWRTKAGAGLSSGVKNTICAIITTAKIRNTEQAAVAAGRSG